MMDHFALPLPPLLLAVPPLLIAVPSLLLAIVAMALAARTPDPMRRAHRRAVRFRDDKQRQLKRLEGKMTEYETSTPEWESLATEAGSLAHEPETTLPTPEPSAVLQAPIPGAVHQEEEAAREEAVVQEAIAEPVPEPAIPLSPLDKKRAHLTGYLDHLLASLDTWARLAGFDLDATVGVRAQVNALVEAVQPPAEDETLSTVANERLPLLITETAKVMLSKTDRDCDPARANATLQMHIEHFLQPETSWRLSVIDPQAGDPLDLREHDSVGMVPTPSPEERGTVARTRVRGLRWKDQVAARAEVLEYD